MKYIKDLKIMLGIEIVRIGFNEPDEHCVKYYTTNATICNQTIEDKDENTITAYNVIEDIIEDIPISSIGCFGKCTDNIQSKKTTYNSIKKISKDITTYSHSELISFFVIINKIAYFFPLYSYIEYINDAVKLLHNPTICLKLRTLMALFKLSSIESLDSSDYIDECKNIFKILIKKKVDEEIINIDAEAQLAIDTIDEAEIKLIKDFLIETANDDTALNSALTPRMLLQAWPPILAPSPFS